MSYWERDPACWTWPIPANLPRDDGWAALAEWQGNRCGICGGRAGQVLDHDHHSGLARGWLCRSCNGHEGRSDGLTDAFARWRACPATAVLGVRFTYVSWLKGESSADHFRWAGFTYLPDWAPPANGWPHAITCSVSAIEKPWGELERPCDHDHVGAVAAALLDLPAQAG